MTTEEMITTPAAWEEFRAGMAESPQDREDLEQEARRCLHAGRICVTDKKIPPPAGCSPHEYVSQAPYWWPDPAKPDGLPYVRRDGETNPEHALSDRASLEHLREAVTCLTLQYQVSGDEAFARRAGTLLRGWFLDPETRMNPNLEYAQHIPGICRGRGIGLIDTVAFCHILDLVCHLPATECWTPQDLAALKAWMADYLDWFLTSSHGRTEVLEPNNHGTWYDVQAVCMALFCGRDDIAARPLETHTLRRIGTQIAPDGSQPHELARTLSLSYCTFNLVGFAILCTLARRLGLDLWNAGGGAGGTVTDAVHWMIPYCTGTAPWKWRQIKPFNPGIAVFLFSLAARGTGDVAAAAACRRMVGHPWNKVTLWRTGVREYGPAKT